jgi:hypothetical protein
MGFLRCVINQMTGWDVLPRPLLSARVFSLAESAVRGGEPLGEPLQPSSRLFLLSPCELAYLLDALSSLGDFFLPFLSALSPLWSLFFCFWFSDQPLCARSTFLARPMSSLTPPPVLFGSIWVHHHLSELFPRVSTIFPRQPSSLTWFPSWVSCFFVFFIRVCVFFFFVFVFFCLFRYTLWMMILGFTQTSPFI